MSTPQNDDTSLDRVRKLLAKAERAGTPEEAEIYNEKARELIARHGIDEALAFAEGKTRDEVGEIWFVAEAPYAGDKARLAHVVSKPLGAKSIRLSGLTHDPDGNRLPKGALIVKIYGYTTDLERVELLYTSLLLQGTQGMVRDSYRGSNGRETMANRRIWFRGFGDAVYQRLDAARERAEQDAQDQAEEAGVSTALVLADRKTAVEEHHARLHPDAKQVRSTYSGTGYGRGHAAGQRADIGQGRVGRERAAIR